MKILVLALALAGCGGTVDSVESAIIYPDPDCHPADRAARVDVTVHSATGFKYASAYDQSSGGWLGYVYPDGHAAVQSFSSPVNSWTWTQLPGTYAVGTGCRFLRWGFNVKTEPVGSNQNERCPEDLNGLPLEDPSCTYEVVSGGSSLHLTHPYSKGVW